MTSRDDVTIHLKNLVRRFTLLSSFLAAVTVEAVGFEVPACSLRASGQELEARSPSAESH